MNEELKFLCKFKKKKYFFFFGGGEGAVLGSQDGCERRIEVFVKVQKKWGGVRGVGLGGGGGVRGVRVDVNKELNFFCENSKKKLVGGLGVGLGGQGGCERRTEVFVKIQKKNFLGGGGGGGLGWGGGQGMCESRIEVFWKIQKKKMGGVRGVGWGVMMDVNEELKFL